MENNVSPAKSGILFGVLFGVVMVLEFVIMYIIGMKSLVGTSVGLIVNLANYLILPILFIYLGCNNYKKNINNGFISINECLKIGVSITFIAALIYAVFNLVFNFIFPEFINEMIAISKEAMLKQNPSMTSDQLETGLSMMKKFMNPLIVFPFTLAMYSFFGLIYSLIVGAILKNAKPQSF
jgi:FlaA1/EpsC-like NDP-sugar epimerase